MAAAIVAPMVSAAPHPCALAPPPLGFDRRGFYFLSIPHIRATCSRGVREPHIGDEWLSSKTCDFE